MVEAAIVAGAMLWPVGLVLTVTIGEAGVLSAVALGAVTLRWVSRFTRRSSGWSARSAVIELAGDLGLTRSDKFVPFADPLAKRQSVRSIQDTTADTAADASTRVSGQLSIMASVVVPAATAHVGRRTRRHTFRGPS